MTSLSAGKLVVRYSKNNDRLSHSIGIETDRGPVVILESIEGSSDDPWPISPPMQQVVSEKIGGQSGDQPVLLGVGLSGNGHWSIAVDAIDLDVSNEAKPAASGSGLRFDVACKTSKPATFLGSTYRLLPSWRMVEVDKATYELKLATDSTPAVSIVMQCISGDLKWRPDESQIAVLPGTSPALATTHRWCHSIKIVK